MDAEMKKIYKEPLMRFEIGLMKFVPDLVKIKEKPLICFDLDETLIRSNKVHILAFNKSFKMNGLKQVPYKKIESELIGKRSEEILNDLYPGLPKKKFKKILRDRTNFVIKETYKYTKQIDNASLILKKLREKYEIGLLSNCRHKEIDALLKGAKIDKKLFDIIIGKDEVKRSKPYPDEIFKAEHLLRRKAVYIIGDSIYDIRAGKKAKVKTIAVLTGNDKLNNIKKEKPYKIIKSIKYLVNIL